MTIVNITITIHPAPTATSPAESSMGDAATPALAPAASNKLGDAPESFEPRSPAASDQGERGSSGGGAPLILGESAVAVRGARGGGISGERGAAAAAAAAAAAGPAATGAGPAATGAIPATAAANGQVPPLRRGGPVGTRRARSRSAEEVLSPDGRPEESRPIQRHKWAGAAGSKAPAAPRPLSRRGRGEDKVPFLPHGVELPQLLERFGQLFGTPGEGVEANGGGTIAAPSTAVSSSSGGAGVGSDGSQLRAASPEL